MANVYWYVVDFSGVGVYRGFVQDQLVKDGSQCLGNKEGEVKEGSRRSLLRH
jgi:hypothetical protein